MNLGQMLMVTGAIVLLGILVLNANSTVYQASDSMYTSEFGMTAISLSTSLVEEAMGKMFDKAVAPVNSLALYDSTLLTPPGALGPESGESYHVPGHDFNDLDDFNNLKICYHGSLPGDADATAGFFQVQVTGLQAKYYVSCTVTYVRPPNLDADYTVMQTWHKKITVKVWSPSALRPGSDASNPVLDTLTYPAVMSYWN